MSNNPLTNTEVRVPTSGEEIETANTRILAHLRAISAHAQEIEQIMPQLFPIGSQVYWYVRRGRKWYRQEGTVDYNDYTYSGETHILRAKNNQTGRLKYLISVFT